MKASIRIVQIIYLPEPPSILALDSMGAIWSFQLRENHDHRWLMIQGPQVDLPDPPPPPVPTPPPFSPPVILRERPAFDNIEKSKNTGKKKKK